MSRLIAGGRLATMSEYLLSIYQPDGPPPPPEVMDPIMRDSTR